jgi:hypothetical protein
VVAVVVHIQVVLVLVESVVAEMVQLTITIMVLLEQQTLVVEVAAVVLEVMDYIMADLASS